jgi:hypothetical protein
LLEAEVTLFQQQEQLNAEVTFFACMCFIDVLAVLGGAQAASGYWHFLAIPLPKQPIWR